MKELKVDQEEKADGKGVREKFEESIKRKNRMYAMPVHTTPSISSDNQA